MLLAIGKTDEAYLETGIAKYIGRLEHYSQFEMKVIPDIKNRKTLSEAQQKKLEGELILAQLQAGDAMVLLDENGKTFSSRFGCNMTILLSRYFVSFGVQDEFRHGRSTL